MAWIESHDELREHPKLKRAARLLEVSTVQMAGHLHFLWWRALQYAQDGDLTGFDPADLADWAGWTGDPEQFIRALVDCRIRPGKHGFIEAHPDGRILLHDWHDYAGKLLKRRADNAERMRDARAAETGRSATARAEHVQCTCDARAVATVPTVPTVPNQESIPPPTPPTVEHDTSPAGSRAAVADAGGTTAKPKRERPKGVNLAPVFAAFKVLGLKRPILARSEETVAGQVLQQLGGEEGAMHMAEWWRDVGNGTWPPNDNGYMQSRRSFSLMATTIGNYLEWCERGRPTETPAPNSRASPEPYDFPVPTTRPSDLPDYDRPWSEIPGVKIS